MLDPLALAIAVTLWASVGGTALAHSRSELLAPVRRTGLLARVVVLDVVLIPVAAWTAVRLVGVPPEWALGILLVGAASAGPLGVLDAQLARADHVLAVAMVSILELANAVAIPVWGVLLMPVQFAAPLSSIVAVLVGFILLPLVAGSVVRAAAPGLARRLVPAVRVVSFAGLAIAIALTAVSSLDLLGPAVRAGVPVASVLLLAFALGCGWVIAGGGYRTRAAVALVTAQRGTSLALAVAIAAFPADREVTASVLVFGLLAISLVPAVAVALRLAPGRLTAAADAPAA